MIVLLNQPFSDEIISGSNELDLRNIGPIAWPRVLGHCRATELRLYHLTIKSLDGIERLTQTKELSLEWATKIEELKPIFQLTTLHKLSVFDFPKIKALNGIEQLNNLVELNISGNLGSLNPPLNINSIEPVTLLTNLSSFSMRNTNLLDDDIRFLSKCSNLKHLNLSNKFDRKQFAFLAKVLNSQLQEPIRAYSATTMRCGHCGNNKVMFTGRKMPFLCQKCDLRKFEKHENEFKEMVESA